jgi:hypothetical protein
MSDKRFLVVIETQRVKGYLFASSILRETRGASLLLDRLNRSGTKEILNNTSGEEVYLGGGSGRILFSSKDEAEAFVHKVQELYRLETTNARVSVEVVERQNGESFPAWVSRGVRESQKNKLARAEAVPLLAGRWIRPCSSCGLAPAEKEPRPDVQGLHRLCFSCWKKRHVVADFYRDLKRNRDAHIPLNKDRLKSEWRCFVLTTLVESIEKHFGKEMQALVPQDFNQIADRSRPRNYIGFIYADGNRMGETIKDMRITFSDDIAARQAYAAFSSIVDQATREAAVQAVLEEVGTNEDTTPRAEPARFVPAEFVLAGGDDLILVVPAHAALPVASRFISLFQERTKQLQDEWVQRGDLPAPFARDGLTTSAGVVLAHASYPASQLVDLAVELMKLAKRKATRLAEEKERPRTEGTLDFMVVHTAGSERVKERRKTEYTQRFNGRTVRLTERPYTATETCRLLDRVRTLKNSDVPRTKLKALYAVLFQSVMQAQFDALHIKERLKATGSLADGSPLQKLVADLPIFPFREGDQHTWTTPLSELIELYDFVPIDNAQPSPGVADA